MVLSSRVVGKFKDRKLVSAVLSRDIGDYERLYSFCYDACQFLKLAGNGNKTSIYDLQGCSKDICSGAHLH